MSEMLKDTLVWMADGSKKRIDDIRIGDCVQSFESNGNACICCINDVWEGQTNEMVSITLEDGEKLLVSKCSVIDTSEGYKRAELLNLSDSIKKESGACKSIKSIVIEPFDDLVYALSLDETGLSTFVVGAGFLVGSFDTMQQWTDGNR